MRSCKWSLRSHYEKQWEKRALMGRLQLSLRVLQLFVAAVERASWAAAVHPVPLPDTWCIKPLLPQILFPQGVLLFHKLWHHFVAWPFLQDWKINKQISSSPHPSSSQCFRETLLWMKIPLIWCFSCFCMFTCVCVCVCHLCGWAHVHLCAFVWRQRTT